MMGKNKFTSLLIFLLPLFLKAELNQDFKIELSDDWVIAVDVEDMTIYQKQQNNLLLNEYISVASVQLPLANESYIKNLHKNEMQVQKIRAAMSRALGMENFQILGITKTKHEKFSAVQVIQSRTNVEDKKIMYNVERQYQNGDKLFLVIYSTINSQKPEAKSILALMDSATPIYHASRFPASAELAGRRQGTTEIATGSEEQSDPLVNLNATEQDFVQITKDRYNGKGLACSAIPEEMRAKDKSGKFLESPPEQLTNANFKKFISIEELKLLSKEESCIYQGNKALLEYRRATLKMLSDKDLQRIQSAKPKPQPDMIVPENAHTAPSDNMESLIGTNSLVANSAGTGVLSAVQQAALRLTFFGKSLPAMDRQTQRVSGSSDPVQASDRNTNVFRETLGSVGKGKPGNNRNRRNASSPVYNEKKAILKMTENFIRNFLPDLLKSEKLLACRNSKSKLELVCQAAKALAPVDFLRYAANIKLDEGATRRVSRALNTVNTTQTKIIADSFAKKGLDPQGRPLSARSIASGSNNDGTNNAGNSSGNGSGSNRFNPGSGVYAAASRGSPGPSNSFQSSIPISSPIQGSNGSQSLMGSSASDMIDGKRSVVDANGQNTNNKPNVPTVIENNGQGEKDDNSKPTGMISVGGPATGPDPAAEERAARLKLDSIPKPAEVPEASIEPWKFDDLPPILKEAAKDPDLKTLMDQLAAKTRKEGDKMVPLGYGPVSTALRACAPDFETAKAKESTFRPVQNGARALASNQPQKNNINVKVDAKLIECLKGRIQNQISRGY